MARRGRWRRGGRTPTRHGDWRGSGGKATVRALPEQFRTLSVSHDEDFRGGGRITLSYGEKDERLRLLSHNYGVFVRVRRALNIPKRRFPARAGGCGRGQVGAGGGAEPWNQSGGRGGRGKGRGKGRGRQGGGAGGGGRGQHVAGVDDLAVAAAAAAAGL
jgi:hypothetical protein